MSTVESISSVYYYETNQKSWKNRGGYSIYIISYQLSGHYDHKFSQNTLSVKRDSLFFIPKGSEYSVKRVEPGKSVCITFYGNLDFPPTVYDCSKNPEIKNMFLKAAALSNLHSKANYCEVMSIVYSLLSFMHKRNTAEYIAHNARSKIEEAHTFITENYTNPSLSVLSIAKRLEISPKYFRTIFKKKYNSTPAQYIISLRLKTSVNYLTESNLSISQIAYLSGFSDVYYFSKLFKARFGFSPKEYRQRQK